MKNKVIRNKVTGLYFKKGRWYGDNRWVSLDKATWYTKVPTFHLEGAWDSSANRASINTDLEVVTFKITYTPIEYGETCRDSIPAVYPS